MLLYSFTGSKIRQSCCPLDHNSVNDTLQCSGCASSKRGSCQTCLGGFTRMGSECVRCSNVHHFADEEGRSCAYYASMGWCLEGQPTPGNENRVNQKYQHLSAAEACCACGGGKHSGTPFEYLITRKNGIGLAGETFLAKPYPRTANRYVLGAGCELAKFGLTFDGNTGVISGTPLVEEPFEISCEVTAETLKAGNLRSVLNGDVRKFTAKVYISAKAFGLESHISHQNNF